MKGALSLAAIKELDKSDMLNLLLDFPDQCRAAMDIAGKARISVDKKDFNKIVFAGLGGSAIGADLVKSYLYFKSKLAISVVREYQLPAYVDGSTLVFISSYSGNTEETIASYEDAKKRGSSIIVVSSGGALKERAQKDGFTFIGIPQGLPPRCSLGYLSLIPLAVLARLALAEDPASAVAQLVKTLEGLRERLHPRTGLKENISKSVAARLHNKYAIIYSASVHFDICAIRMRGQLAENSKALSSSHVFPEMNHNEIVGWENPGKLFKDFVVVMLKDKGMYPRVIRRMDITEEILRKEDIKIIEINSIGEDLLSRIFSLIY
ncbi:MAG TPA: bifunctional phosphoglucose/phosphomannose isomerase, partial [Candidatus Margulisiibacteriota bacterium]|nr:bifunctional phosphoglucose/phosphomannose isomerase [Candidatus Margulisiibacteriota bacterium]